MSSFDYQKSTITKYRAGTSSDPYIDITETKPVVNGQIQLNEIPVSLYKVRIPDMFEVPHTNSKVLGANEYRVDYTEGIVSLHSSTEGNQKTCTYKGRGNHFVSAARIWTREQDGNVIQTLEDVTRAASNFYYSGVYSPITKYETYNIVKYMGSTYMCIRPTSGNDPTNTTYWKLISGQSFKGAYSSQINYDSGDVVVDDNNTKMLQSKVENNLNNQLDDSSKWELLLDLTSVINEANLATQNANNATQEAILAAEDAVIAKIDANEATTNANTATIAANDAASSANNLVETFVSKGQYNSTTIYNANNIVLYNGSSWKCLKTSQGNTPSEDEFWTLVAIRGVDGQGAVSTVNGISPDQSGNVSLTADEVGAETPAGAQSKVDALSELFTYQLSDILNPPRARYSSNVNKTCPTLTWTSPDWNLMIYDTENFIDQLNPTKIKINKSGTYLIQAQVTFEANENGQRNIKIVKNDTQEQLGYSSNRSAINATRINVSTTAFLNAGEYLNILCYHDVYPDNQRFDTSGGMSLTITMLCPP